MSSSITLTHTLTVNGGVSNTFEVPTQFVGHVYIHSVGDQQAVFLVGCDGNARFSGGGGFKILVGSNNLRRVDIEEVDVEGSSIRRWKLTNVPDGYAPTVVLIGAVKLS